MKQCTKWKDAFTKLEKMNGFKGLFKKSNEMHLKPYSSRIWKTKKLSDYLEIIWGEMNV